MAIRTHEKPVLCEFLLVQFGACVVISAVVIHVKSHFKNCCVAFSYNLKVLHVLWYYYAYLISL